MSEILAGRIRELRIKKGLTQESLGRLIGVTTQAVSKWERGSTPDAEILPLIADAFGVTIDFLFGREQEKNAESEIRDILSGTEPAEAFQKAFHLCWAIETGLTGLNSLKDQFTSEMLDTLQDEYGYEYYSKLLTDNGLVCARLSKDCRYFFLLPETENGWKEYFSDKEALSAVFRLLADMNILKIIDYMYSRMNTPVSLSCIALQIQKDEKYTEKLMDQLCENHLAVCTVVEMDKGEIKTYTYRQECSLIPLLCYAKEIKTEKLLDFVVLFNRTKPLF